MANIHIAKGSHRGVYMTSRETIVINLAGTTRPLYEIEATTIPGRQVLGFGPTTRAAINVYRVASLEEDFAPDDRVLLMTVSVDAMKKVISKLPILFNLAVRKARNGTEQDS